MDGSRFESGRATLALLQRVPDPHRGTPHKGRDHEGHQRKRTDDEHARSTGERPDACRARHAAAGACEAPLVHALYFFACVSAFSSFLGSAFASSLFSSVFFSDFFFFFFFLGFRASSSASSHAFHFSAVISLAGSS